MSGELFSGLLLDDIDQRALALEAVLGKVVDDDTRVVWVGNPLRSPLTIERFLIQIVGPEVDLREERGPAEVAKLIAKPVGRASRVLIVVQQPETINPEMRDLLVGMGGYLAGEAVQIQFLFAGPCTFTVPRLAQPDLSALSSQLQPSPPTIAVAPATRRRDIAPLVLLLLTITIGVMISIAPASHEGVPPPARAPAPMPVVDDTSLLRREFDAFLAQRTPALPPMTGAERDALFNAFLTYHRRE